MGDFPGRPRVTKGALLAFGSKIPVPTQIIVFPFNPDAMTRRFDLGPGAATRSAAGASAPTTDATSPTETLSLTLQLDAADQLEHPNSNPVTVVSGLLPVISALEQLIHPSQVLVQLTRALAELGVAVISPPTTSWTVLVWGAGRVLPVKVSGLTVTEQAFDARLNPISARAELQLTALTTSDLVGAPVALRALATVHAVSREVLAGVNTAQSAAHLTSVLPL
ncbi:hypothetical protein AB0O75_05470 [Streptomyces sp. NPDC088921]|uniref:hypothetical protein n=1 Tax=unclassified Streptomyces TaxID=2593676 RepID=UPI003430CD63